MIAVSLILVLATTSTAVAEEEAEAPADDPLSITSDDDNYSLTISPILQARYSFETDDDTSNGTFFLPLVRLDVQGHAFSPDLTYRVMPDFAGSTRLLDGWVSYRFFDGLNIRGGQFNIPFNWERHLPPTRHQFGIRSAANNEFQWPTGRDIGVMAHGDPIDQIRYGVGIFNGEGLNTRGPASTDLLFSGRLVYTPIGDYATSEVPFVPAQQLNLSVGAGAYYTPKTHMRDDWNRWSATTAPEAGVLATTADAHLRWSQLSMHLTGFYRSVDPDLDAAITPQPPVDEGDLDYSGTGGALHLGALLMPERLFGGLRYSQSHPNLDEDAGSRRELLGGLHIFHRANNSKFQIESGLQSQHDGDDWNDGFLARLQYQLTF